MKFRIVWSKPATRELKKLDRVVAKRIFEKVGEFERGPYEHVAKLAGLPYYRMRVGDYRVIVDIKNDTLRVLVLKIGHRKKIYG